MRSIAIAVAALALTGCATTLPHDPSETHPQKACISERSELDPTSKTFENVTLVGETEDGLQWRVLRPNSSTPRDIGTVPKYRVTMRPCAFWAQASVTFAGDRSISAEFR